MEIEPAKMAEFGPEIIVNGGFFVLPPSCAHVAAGVTKASKRALTKGAE